MCVLFTFTVFHYVFLILYSIYNFFLTSFLFFFNHKSSIVL